MRHQPAFEPEELACYNAQPKTVSYVPPPPVRPAAPIIVDTAVEAVPKAARSGRGRSARRGSAQGKQTGGSLVRRTMNDIGSFTSPTPFDDATGALFAWADDRIADNEVWSAQGAVAVPFVHHGDVQRDAPYVSTLTLAPYANFDRVANSKKSDEDVGGRNLTYGAVFELGCANVMLATQDLGQQRGGFELRRRRQELVGRFHLAADRRCQPRRTNSIFSYMGTPLPFGRNFLLHVSPKIDLDYANDLSNASAQPIFAEHDEALRTGPTVTLALNGKKREFVPWWEYPAHTLRGQLWLAL